jgi:hypothetical protein
VHQAYRVLQVPLDLKALRVFKVKSVLLVQVVYKDLTELLVMMEQLVLVAYKVAQVYKDLPEPPVTWVIQVPPEPLEYRAK